MDEHELGMIGTAMPFFSVIIATRDRPVQFRQALASVLAQSWLDTEIVVVNDGSASEYQSQYDSILSSVDTRRVRAFSLERTSKGHGQSYALNFGAKQAEAAYLCFLDDDDCWIDPAHLERAQAVIAGAPARVDLYMTNQAAFFGTVQKPGPIWIEDLPGILTKRGSRPDRNGAHTVTVEDLLQSQGFCHLNTMIVRRGLYEEIGGMEESIRWECDHDLFYRLIDRAAIIKFAPVTVARHNIPDPAKAASMTTALSEVDRRLFQLTVFRRAQCLCQHEAIRAHAHRHFGYTLKRISESFAAAGQYHQAASYARRALRVGPTLKWASYTAWLTFRAQVI